VPFSVEFDFDRLFAFGMEALLRGMEALARPARERPATRAYQ